MRYVRDKLIASTPTGRTLVDAFNAFYYSWSPSVAHAIAGSAPLRAAFRVLLLPLVAIVHATELTFIATFSATGSTCAASLIAFLSAAYMTLATYVALPIVVALKLKQRVKERHHA